MTPNASRRLYLFGALRVEADGRAFPFAGRKALSLLAYLALHPAAPQSRETLAELLWPEMEPDRSRRSLNDVLYRLRQTLGEGWLSADEDRIALRVDGDLWVDVWEFNRLLSLGDLDAIGRAVTLYAGDLLPEIYDDWILLQRAELHERFLAALSRLGEAAEERGDVDSAFTAYYRLAQADPLSEAAYRGLMRVYVRLGRHATALQQYARLARLLADELKTEPLPETRALAEQIRAEQAARASLQERHRLARPAFVGRVRERGDALETVEAAIAGHGRWFAVEGPAGIGKSRFLEELSASARWRGVMVAAGQAREYPAAAPFAPLAEALAMALAGPRAAQVEMLLPKENLAALAALFPAWRDRTPLPEMPPAQARDLFHHMLASLFQSLASLSPHLIILDDMHWATPALWAALDAIAASTVQSRLSFGIAYRRPEIEQSAGWASVQRWEREGRLTMTSLRALDESEVAELLPAEHRPNAGTIFAVTGGNPFYVTQATIALNEGYALDNRPVLTRAAALPETTRQALTAAAVLGKDVPFRLWAGMVDMPPTRLAEVADHLVAQYFLQPDEGGYLFAHDLIQSIVYDQIGFDQRQRLHNRAAHALADLDRSNVRALAYHHERAGLAAQAAAYYSEAGAQDLERFAFADAQAMLEQALTLMPAAPTTGRVNALLTVAQICDSTGDRARQTSALNEALQDAQGLNDEGLVLRARLGLGRLAAVTGEVETATGHLAEALSLAGRFDDLALRFDAYFYSGDLAARRGQLTEAGTCFESALQEARAMGDGSREGRALRGLSLTLRLSGKLAESLAWAEQALTVQKACGDRFGASVTQANVLGTLYDLGAWDRLMTQADEALKMKEALGDRHGAAVVRHMQGLAAYSLGDFELARRMMEAARLGFEDVQDRRSAGLSRNTLGMVAEAEGRLEDARRDYEAAIASAESVKAVTEAAYAQHDLGALLVRMGEAAEAIRLLESAREVWREQGHALLRLKSEAWLGLALLKVGERPRASVLADEGWAAFQSGAPSGELPQGWLWAFHQLLLELGESARARDALQAAYTEVQRQASALQDARLRQGFLQLMPLNRDIVTAFEPLTKAARHINLRLARADAPLGKTLTDADRVEVRWTVDAGAADAEFLRRKGKVALRRHRLQRLIAEAQTQGAAPTDSDLAAALGVNVRTIERDMAALRKSGETAPTRKRK